MFYLSHKDNNNNNKRGFLHLLCDHEILRGIFQKIVDKVIINLHIRNKHRVAIVFINLNKTENDYSVYDNKAVFTRSRKYNF